MHDNSKYIWVKAQPSLMGFGCIRLPCRVSPEREERVETEDRVETMDSESGMVLSDSTALLSL